ARTPISFSRILPQGSLGDPLPELVVEPLHGCLSESEDHTRIFDGQECFRPSRARGAHRGTQFAESHSGRRVRRGRFAKAACGSGEAGWRIANPSAVTDLSRMLLP